MAARKVAQAGDEARVSTGIVQLDRLPCGCQISAPTHQLWHGCVLLQPEGTAVAPTGKEGQERQRHWQ